MKYQETIQHYTDSEIMYYKPTYPINPTTLVNPNFLMNLPFSFHATEPNNVWMEGLSDAERAIDTTKTFQEFQQLYRFMVDQGAFVHLMPAPTGCRLQDLVFCANAGIVLTHLEDKNTVIVSNFTSPPRFGETDIIKTYFQSMGYNTIVSPYKFEGEADLKRLYDNIYIGGYGIRSEEETYNWMSRNFDMKIIKVRMKHQTQYHLDCSIFPITIEDTMVYIDGFEKSEIKEIEKYTNIIPVDRVSVLCNITNCVRIGNSVMHMIDHFLYDTNKYTSIAKAERHTITQLEKICGRLGLQPQFFALNEYKKGGAALSCLIMHLN